MNLAKRTIKTMFIFLLLSINVWKIIIPSISKFLEGGILIEVSTEEVDGVIPPDITICRETSDRKFERMLKSQHYICLKDKNKSSREIQDCFDENTFFLNETVYGGTVSNLNIFHDMSKWMIDNSNVNLGRCHTYTHPTPLKTKKISDGIRFLLNPNATSYLILLHDPNFYFVYGLPSVFFPSIFKRYYKDKNQLDVLEATFDERHTISVTEHILLNTPKRPCEDKSDYDYRSCVLSSMVRKSGCKPFWLSSASISSSLCQETKDVMKFREITANTLFPAYKNDIFKKTGCLIPCKYKEYKIESVEKKLRKKNFEYFGFYVRFHDRYLKKHKETLVYPAISFVSELGGSLGLFVGFSFLTIWDYFDVIVQKLLNIRCTITSYKRKSSPPLEELKNKTNKGNNISITVFPKHQINSP